MAKNTTWINGEDGLMEVTINEDGTVYGYCNKYDFKRDTVKEAIEQLKAWNFVQI